MICRTFRHPFSCLPRPFLFLLTKVRQKNQLKNHQSSSSVFNFSSIFIICSYFFHRLSELFLLFFSTAEISPKRKILILKISKVKIFSSDKITGNKFNVQLKSPKIHIWMIKILYFPYLVYSQIWLNLPMDDGHFGWLLHKIH